MAWRLADYMVHGRIDCSRRGEITGEVWLKGIDEPIGLRLTGYPCQDLAGCILEFRTSNELKTCTPEYAEGFALNQIGRAGDITASRKCKVPTVSDEEFDALYRARMEIPMVWKNILYIEWYSQSNGRVVIELAHAKWQVDTPRWRMTDEEIQQRAEDSARAATGFIDRIVEAYENQNLSIREQEDAIDLNAEDEHSWERRLKANDDRTDALMEALDQCETEEEFDQVLNDLFPVPTNESLDKAKKSFDVLGDAAELASFSLECYPELLELFRTLKAHVEDELMCTMDMDSSWSMECVTLGVKARTIAELALAVEHDLEPGYLIALAKREIARCQSILAKMAEATEQEGLRQSVSVVRDMLLQINGALRGLH